MFFPAFQMFAQAAPATGNPGNPLSSLLIFVPIFGLMYFLMIRPQKKKQRQHEQMLTTLKAGDRVMMTCGLLGRVLKVTEKSVVVELAEGAKAEFVRAAVADILTDSIEGAK